MESAAKIAVIGGGAAGFFAAIRCASANRNTDVAIFEKSNSVLSKVRISGGGRCNVTHACFDPKRLSTFFPRGSRELKSCFAQFHPGHTVEWFESHGVTLKTEEDGRMFPVTDSSLSVINCLLEEAGKYHVAIKTKHAVTQIKKTEDKFLLTLNQDEEILFDRVLIASGGNPNPKSYDWLKQLGHSVVTPVPSLFTFNIPESPLKGLEGISVPNAILKITGTSLHETGPLLITHWGISGPVVLRTSAWGARVLHEKKYDFEAVINWAGIKDETELRNILLAERKNSSVKKIVKRPLFNLPTRLWILLCGGAGIAEQENFSDLSNSKLNALLENIIRFKLQPNGKTTFKEEFVTCGGVSLNEINFKTMESKITANLFFAGEVLDIDGITGGFNFQSAWTTGWIAGSGLASIKGYEAI